MPPKFTPPSNWRQLYARIADYRKTLQAPVDTVGCHCLKDPNAPKEDQRFHILVALMLSAQTKDAVTAAAMGDLLAIGLTPQSISAMPAETLDKYICKVGFHNNKTRYIKQVADILLKEYHGTVPREYDQLVALPGVGPKMAHLFVQEADGQVLGIGVDTHVHRIAQRFRWVPSSVKTPEDTRKALEAWLPREHWGTVNHLLVGLGQTVCAPVNPHCADCKLVELCPNAFREKSRITAKSSSRSPSRTPRKEKAGKTVRGEVVDIENVVVASPLTARSASATPPSRKKVKK